MGMKQIDDIKATHVGFYDGEATRTDKWIYARVECRQR